MLLIDASVACKWYLDEAGSDAARAIVASGEELAAPDILLVEAGSALWRCHRRGEISAVDAEGALAGLGAVFDRLVATPPLVVDALLLAMQLGHPIYDCLYLAAARSTGLRLVTADRRLLSIVQGTDWEERVCGLDDLSQNP